MPKPPAHAARLEGSRWTPYLFVAPFFYPRYAYAAPAPAYYYPAYRRIVWIPNPPAPPAAPPAPPTQ